MSQQLICKVKNNDADVDAFIESAQKYWEEHWGPLTPKENVMQYRKCVEDRFKNNRFRAKGGKEKLSPGPTGESTSLPTFFSLTQQPDPTLYELFCSERSEDINKAVNEQREKNCTGHQQHLGMLRKELSSEYKSTKTLWVAKAWNGSKRCYQMCLLNLVFTAQMEDFLESILGRGRGKIGNGSFVLLYSYRAADNALKMGCINATANKAPKLPALYPLEYNQIKNIWGNYCNRIIPLNQDITLTRSQKLFTCSEDGCPHFPIGQLDLARTPPVEVEGMLRNYLQAQYDYAWYKARGVGIGPTDWEHVEYSDMLPEGLELRVPIDGDYGYVFQLYSYFSSQLKQPIQVFKIKDANTNMSISSGVVYQNKHVCLTVTEYTLFSHSLALRSSDGLRRFSVLTLYSTLRITSGCPEEPGSPASEAIQPEPESSSEAPEVPGCDDSVIPYEAAGSKFFPLADLDIGGDMTPDVVNVTQVPASPSAVQGLIEGPRDDQVTPSRRQVSPNGQLHLQDGVDKSQIELDHTPGKRAQETSHKSVFVPNKQRKSSQPTRKADSGPARSSLATPTRQRRSARVASQNVVEVSAESSDPRSRVIRSGRSGKGTWEEVSVCSDEGEN
ncbi:hypothetical protein E1B28_009515 [Marasmius oreades]|uniref:Uncharacterized protein n=1 Tax=Marasmius oreades TaxID=181124 RepID=A0A9P7RWC6_9AGAR|nr:uncharacterized protein E1B28_009515 [Marasmius oreades]KAG7090396.1 hypothetical protein E1B28_009515 [Marasmius oreades]